LISSYCRHAISAMLLCPLYMATLLHAQSPAPPHDHNSHMDSVGYIPRAVLQLPITLRNNVGDVDDAVTTSLPEAQAFYNQGVACLHNYVWIDAARSFNQALRLDPQLAMAHVGLFRVFINLNDLPAAAEEVRRAQALQASVSDRERLRIAVTAKHLEARQDLQNHEKHEAYKQALDAALNSYPEDVELWLLRGNAEEPAADGRGQRGTSGSIAFYMAALAYSPDNFAAHHYLTHSLENIGRNQDAEKHGQRNAQLADGVPHAHHMWGHDLRLVGKIDAAIEQFEIANQLEKSWYQTDGLDPSLDWHRPHNLDLLSRSLQHEGRMNEAEKYIREATHLRPTTAYAAYGKKMLPDFLLARGRAEEALASATEMQKSPYALGRLEGHVLTGRDLLALNRVEEARAQLAAAEKEIPEARKDFTGVVTFERYAGEELDELRGELLLRTSGKRQADDILSATANALSSRRGADALEELYLLEHIARIAREQQQWELAQRAADLMITFDPNYFGAHYAAALVALHHGDAVKTQEEFAAAKKLWAHADPGLPEISQLNATLQAGVK
jgi:tetratricopeptide (TPR) repeat protein